jgi:hypothetical protein
MLAACSSDGGGTPTTPTTLNLAGTWAGTMPESSADPDPDRLSWTATQSGANLSGPAALTMMASTPGGTPKVATGTITGVLAGTQLSLTFTLPAGSLVSAGGPAGCSVTGTLTSTPTATSITGTMTRTFSAACLGVVVSSSTDTPQLLLTKQ